MDAPLARMREPLVPIERVRLRGDGPETTLRLYNADLLDSPIDALDGSVALVYFDPPFGTGDRFEAHVDAFEKRLRVPAYDDVWEDGIDGLLTFIAPRLERIHRLLAPDGSLVLHADHRATPYLAVMCDRIFGRGDREGTGTRPGFRNEIIWRYGLGGSSNRSYPKKHDVLLWYTKGEAWHFEAPRVPATSRRMAGLDKKCPDVWDIPSLNNMANERNGYPTQKPEALLERIIAAHTREGALVLDPGFGSGTTAAVAHRLGRDFVGMDPSSFAFHRTRARLFDAPAARTCTSLSSFAPRREGEGARVSFGRREGQLVVEGVSLPSASVNGFDAYREDPRAVERVRIGTSGEDAAFEYDVGADGPPASRDVTVEITDVLGRRFRRDDLAPPLLELGPLDFTRVG